MLRVVLLANTFPKLSETFILNKFWELFKLGWDIHVVCSSSDKKEWKHFPEIEKVKGIRTQVHTSWPHRPRWLAAVLIPLMLLRCFGQNPSSTWRYLTRGWHHWGVDVFRRLYLDAEIVVLDPDLIHIEFGALAPERIHLEKLLGTKIVVSFRGYDLHHVGLQDSDYYCTVWEGSTALHLLGEDLWRRAQARGCPATKTHVLIPPAIDTEFFNSERALPLMAAGSKVRPLRILSVGRLEWVKGYEFGLQAIKLLLDHGICCEYHIVGDGNHRTAILFTMYDLGLQNVVQFLGTQSPEKVKDEMRWADVFLHSAVSEGFCNAVLEAQAMGLPIVCTDAGGLKENVAHRETGFVVPRRNPLALAEKLAYLAQEPVVRQQLGEAGRERVLSRFHLSNQIEAFVSFYQTILKDA